MNTRKKIFIFGGGMLAGRTDLLERLKKESIIPVDNPDIINLEKPEEFSFSAETAFEKPFNLDGKWLDELSHISDEQMIHLQNTISKRRNFITSSSGIENMADKIGEHIDEKMIETLAIKADKIQAQENKQRILRQSNSLLNQLKEVPKKPSGTNKPPKKKKRK